MREDVVGPEEVARLRNFIDKFEDDVNRDSCARRLTLFFYYAYIVLALVVVLRFKASGMLIYPLV